MERKNTTVLVTKTVVTREEILNTIKELAEKLGRPPSYSELNRILHVSTTKISALFGKWSEAVRECGFEPTKRKGFRTAQELFEDYARIVAKIGEPPSASEYERQSVFSSKPLRRRFKDWEAIAPGMLDYAKRKGIVEEWQEATDILIRHVEKLEEAERTSALLENEPSVSEYGPLYGRPLMLPAMAMAPTNEQGVLCLFAMLAQRLGFMILRVQSEFPDLQVMRRLGKHWRMMDAELEFESRNYLLHMHPEKGCGLIICWKHNWPGCAIEVLELEKIVNELAACPQLDQHGAEKHSAISSQQDRRNRA